MLWRKFKLDWSYAIGELIIVTLGVLVALGISQWQQDVEDHKQELEYVERIKSDLRGDITRFKEFTEIELSEKTKVLKALSTMEENATSFDHSIINSKSLYYSDYKALPETQSAAYSELTSTGKLHLIQQPSIRVELEDYYDFHELMSGILAESSGAYREMFAGAMSGTAAHDWRVNKIEIPDSEIMNALRTLRSHPDFRSAVNAELSYSASMIFWLREVRLTGEALLKRLESEYPG